MMAIKQGLNISVLNIAGENVFMAVIIISIIVLHVLGRTMMKFYLSSYLLVRILIF